jgi:uncharacterized membrane protein
MPFCGKCGASIVEGAAFCGSCGAPMAAPPTVARAGAAAQPIASNVAGLLCYVLAYITGILFLVWEPYKNDKFVRFHAFQSIFFGIVVTVFWIVWNTLFLALFHFLWFILGPLSSLISLALFVLWIFLMYKAYNHERYMLPVIGEMAAKKAG